MKPIEKMTMETVPARFDGRDGWVMWGKINDEIIPAINELLAKGINMAALTPLTCEFDVVDTKTGEYPDLWKIALTEEWAKGLMYCDMDGFAIREDGSLILLDECGNCVSCPQGRFEIRRPPEKEDVL